MSNSVGQAAILTYANLLMNNYTSHLMHYTILAKKQRL